MASWYLRKSDGAEYGPADIDALRQWAEDGRIAPEDELSEDRANWVTAPSVAGLEMDFEILLDNGDTYGPLHVLALRELITDGSITLDTPIRHITSQETKSAAERLLYVFSRRHMHLLARIEELADENQGLARQAAEVSEEKISLQEQMNELSQQVATLEKRLAEAPTPPPKGKEPQASSTVLGRDDSLKDAQKWKVLYEAEHTQRLEAEEKLAEENRELRHQLHEAQSARDRLSYRATQLEKNVEQLQGTLDGTGMGDSTMPTAVMESYQQLSDNYDSLLEQLREKTDELNTLREDRDAVEQEAGTRVRQLEDRLHREREESDKTRRRLEELESTHIQIVRSFRELNDRYIRLRQQAPASPAQNTPKPPASSPSEPKSGEKEEVTTSSEKPSSDTKAQGKPKLRLT